MTNDGCPKGLRPALFLDRDGVLIEDRTDFVRSWDDVTILGQAVEALRLITAAGIPVVIVTNQSLVGRGILPLEVVQEIHERILDSFRSVGARFLASYICPHRPEDGCICRKPKPGMLIEAARDHGLDLRRSILVGDAIRDLQAAEAVHAKGMLVRTGKGLSEELTLIKSGAGNWPAFDDLLSLVPSLVGELAGAN